MLTVGLGKNITIYLADGTVTGIRHAQLINWTGQAIACPRKKVVELATWEEANRPGVYILFGYDEESSEFQAYIGEAENVLARLQKHLTNKDFWNEVIFFTNKDENLTKAHVKYLESRLVEIGIKQQRYKIFNVNSPQKPTLPRGDRDSMEEFVLQTKDLIGVLGHKVFEPYISPDLPVSTKSSSTSALNTEEVEVSLCVKNIIARALITNEGYLILEGSKAALHSMDSLSSGYKKLRDKLISQNILSLIHDHYVFTKNYLFTSPSSAAAIIVGYPINGRVVWKDKNGKSISDLESNNQKNITLDDS